jgi:hypothetical protein
VATHLSEADAILSLAFFPINAADGYIVVYLHCIPVILSKTPAHKSLTLRWRSFSDMFTILSEACLPRTAANSINIGHCGRIAP